MLKTPLPISPPLAPTTMRSASRAALALAMAHAILAAAAYLVLAANFGFPDILREPGEIVLPAFNRASSVIRAAYYAFMLSSVLYVPIALLLRHAAPWTSPGLVDVAAGFGVLAGFAQVLGFARWPLYVPFLADAYAAAEPMSTTRESVLFLYEAANRYSGMTVGEHLGWLFQGLWVVCLSIAVARLAPWLGWLGCALGFLLLVSTAEQFQAGFASPLGLLNAFATTALPFWMIGAAIWLVRGTIKLWPDGPDVLSSEGLTP